MGVSAGSCKATGMGVVCRLPLVTQPKPLAIVCQQFHRRTSAIAEDEHRANEGILSKGLLAEPCQTVDPAAEVGRLDGHEDLHLGRDLEHHSAFHKLLARAWTSAAS